VPLYSAPPLYRVGQNSGPQAHDHTSVKSYPVKFFSLEDSLVNFQLNGH